MSGPPSFGVQKQIMRTLATRRIETPDVWEYAVARSWLMSWEGTEPQSPREPEEKLGSFTMISKELEEVRKSSMIREPQSASMRPVYMAESDAENTYVPETQWKLYTSWFGLDRRHQLRRRPTHSQYLSLEPVWTPGGVDVLSDRELDFLPVWVCSLEELVTNGTPRLVNVFAWDNLGYIETQVRRVLDIDKKRTIRLWFNIKENEQDIILEPIHNFKQSLLSKVVEVVPHVRDVMATRQCQSSSQYSFQGDGNTEVRQHLSQVWFGTRILSIGLAVEVVGFVLSGETTDQGVASQSGLDEDIDSIVTISSIRNEWDDILATHFERYVEDMGEKTHQIKERLLTSARNIVGEKIDELNEIKTDYEIRFAAMSKQEAAVKARENAVTEQEKDLNERLGRFKTGLMDFQQRQQQLAEELRRIESQNKIAASKVVLNVGGNHFTTSLATLTAGEENSLLAMMFSGRHNLQQEPDGSYFLDRDSTNFRYILNYLRDGDKSVDSIADHGKLIKELLVEADFYKLPRFQKLLREKLAQSPLSVSEGAERHLYMSV